MGVAKRRRWFSFSLRTLFVLVTVICLCFAWQWRISQKRLHLLRDVQGRGGLIGHDANREATFSVRRLMGDTPIGSIALPAESFTEDERLALRDAFPEATVRVLDLVDGIQIPGAFQR